MIARVKFDKKNMLHVTYYPCPMLPLRCHMSNFSKYQSFIFLVVILRSMLYVNFKKLLCRHIKFRGQGRTNRSRIQSEEACRLSNFQVLSSKPS